MERSGPPLEALTRRLAECPPEFLEEPLIATSGTIHTAVEEIEKAGGKGLALMCDVRSEESVAAAVAKTVETFGGIDICVNNASAINLTGTEALDMKRYDLMHGINTRGTFVTSKACIPYLKKAANPHVLILSPPLNMEERGFRFTPALLEGEPVETEIRFTYTFLLE